MIVKLDPEAAKSSRDVLGFTLAQFVIASNLSMLFNNIATMSDVLSKIIKSVFLSTGEIPCAVVDQTSTDVPGCGIVASPVSNSVSNDIPPHLLDPLRRNCLDSPLPHCFPPCGNIGSHPTIDSSSQNLFENVWIMPNACGKGMDEFRILIDMSRVVADNLQYPIPLNNEILRPAPEPDTSIKVTDTVSQILSKGCILNEILFHINHRLLEASISCDDKQNYLQLVKLTIQPDSNPYILSIAGVLKSTDHFEPVK